MRWHETDDEIGKSSDDEFVSAFRVKGKIAQEKLMQEFPIGLVHIDKLTRLHHLLHGPPEVGVGIGGQRGHGDAVAEEVVVEF